MPIESKYANGRVEQAVHHAQTCSEVIELLGDIKVPGVEDHTEDPAREATVSKSDVVFAQRVAGGYFSLQPRHAPVVGKEVEEREENARWLLYA